MNRKLSSLLLTFILLIAIGQAVSAEGQVKIGYDFPGNYLLKINDSSTSTPLKTGTSLCLEYLTPLDTFSNSRMGVGLEYQSPRSLKDNAGEINFIALYWVENIYFTAKTLTPYLTGRLGYNFFYNSTIDNPKGGLYTGLGGGFRLSPHTSVEAFYSLNTGSYSQGAATISSYYTRASFLMGYSF